MRKFTENMRNEYMLIVKKLHSVKPFEKKLLAKKSSHKDTLQVV